MTTTTGPLTEARARRMGWRLVRGSYSGTTDDRIDRWYWDEIASNVIDHRGPGFATKRDALQALAESASEAERQ